MGGECMNSIYIQRTIRFFLVIFMTLLSCVFLFFIGKYAYPFVIAAIIAFLINPIVDFFEFKVRLPRFLAVLISILLVVGGILAICILFIVEIIAGANYLSQVLPNYLAVFFDYILLFFNEKIMPMYQTFTSIFNHLNSNQQESITSNIGDITKNIATNLGLFLSSLLGKIPLLFSWVPNAATGLVVSILGTFFISKDWYKIKSFIVKYSPAKVLKSISYVVYDLKNALFGFFRAQTTLISLTILTLLIGFIILDINYAITIALIIGLVDIIPYLGTGLVFIPWILFELMNADYQAAIGLSVLYLIIVVQRQVLEPKILSSNIGLNPLATLIAVFIGYKIFGLIGLMLGPIIFIIISTLHRANIFKDALHFILETPNNKKPS